ncbi:PIG-L deacetylase family protein [Erythrobacter sp.]|uniref:PIG-L deacetylase family protein n=1 Tax=Erythrobacter sp. TaxID=1042 RepID=UPI002EB2AF2E|nr:PIG-L family deacetylase [Erythrobacter sp.]
MLDATCHWPEAKLGDLLPRPGLAILAPHPDDETFGCGMALAAAAASTLRPADAAIRLILLTDGEGSHRGSPTFPPARLADLRRRELSRALAILSPATDFEILSLSLPDGQCDPDRLDPQAKARACSFLEHGGCGTLWTTWAGDPHCDHVYAARLGAQLARDLDLALLTFPVWGRFGEHRPPANGMTFFDRAGAAAKRRAAQAYASQTTDLISDDPDGFQMPPAIAAHLIEHHEIFFRER